MRRFIGPRGGTTTVTKGDKLRKTVYFEPELWTIIQKETIRLGCSYSELISRAVRSFVDRERGDAQPLAEFQDEGSVESSLRRLHEDIIGILHRTLDDREALRRIASERLARPTTTGCWWARWTERDGSIRRVWLDDQFQVLTGYTPDEYERIGRRGLIHPDDFEQVDRFIDGPEGLSEHEFRIVRKDGRVRRLHEIMWVQEDDGRVLSVGFTTAEPADLNGARPS